MTSIRCAHVVVAAAIIGGGAKLDAQGYPASQRASITQHVALTTIRLEYGRPVARGRALFGALVPWDSIWHPGADSATRVSFDHDVVLEGKPVRAGDYSLWIIPREKSDWTLILSRVAHTFHKPYPGERSDYLRVEVAPTQESHMESLAWYFPSVLRDEAILRMQWGTTALPIRLSAPFKPK